MQSSTRIGDTLTNVVTQPYRRPNDPREDNYLATLAVDFDLQSAIQAQGVTGKIKLDRFLIAHPSGRSRLWAVHGNGPGIRAWEKMSEGDLVVFYGNGEIYAYGEISSKIFWKGNNFVWPSGTDWDYMYSIRNFQEIPPGSRPIYEELRRVLGKLDVMSVGIRSLDEAGLSKAEFLEFVLKDAERSKRLERSEKRSKGPEGSLRDVLQNPPRLGETFRNREEIWRAFGGQKVKGICVFPNDSVLNVFSDEDGPYPDYINELEGVIEYRGQGLGATQKLADGNKLLEQARLDKSPIRFWFRPSGDVWRFYDWVIAADRDVVSDIDQSGNTAERILWFLVPVHTEDPSAWPPQAKELSPISIPAEVSPAPVSRVPFAERYKKAGTLPGVNERQSRTASRTNFRRNRTIRNLVLERAKGNCEFDGCTGMPPDIKANGEPILEVDHIDPLGNGGVDHPSNMIALCPNCHEAKTHGKERGKMIRRLKGIVKTKEDEIL